MWRRLFNRVCGHLLFSRVTVRGAERRPARGPVLWLGLHRNGAVDGYVYAVALGRPLVFLISAQLRRNAFARIFFDGIAVARRADEGDAAGNPAALAACLDVWRRGGDLFVFPEGTSSLGPRHLPFKAGAVQLMLDWQDAGGGKLSVVPLAIHYDRPWAFRSRAEVVVGQAIDPELPAGLSPLARRRELRRRMTAALEETGVNFPDAAAQRQAEAIATFAAVELGRARSVVLKACEAGVPAPLAGAWRELDARAAAAGAARYHELPLVAAGTGLGEGLVVLGLGPLVLAGIAANAPPWVAAWAAARRWADDRNVIALWKLLAGLPVLAAWAGGVVVGLAVTGRWSALAAYALLSVGAWAGYDWLKRAVVRAANVGRRADLRPATDRLRTELRAAFPR